MEKHKQNKFTQYVSLGWWISFAVLIMQIVVISIFNLTATPIFGVILFASFVTLSMSAHYNKESEFSPYLGLKKLFKSLKR